MFALHTQCFCRIISSEHGSRISLYSIVFHFLVTHKWIGWFTVHWQVWGIRCICTGCTKFNLEELDEVEIGGPSKINSLQQHWANCGDTANAWGLMTHIFATLTPSAVIRMRIWAWVPSWYQTGMVTFSTCYTLEVTFHHTIKGKR